MSTEQPGQKPSKKKRKAPNPPVKDGKRKHRMSNNVVWGKIKKRMAPAPPLKTTGINKSSSEYKDTNINTNGNKNGNEPLEEEIRELRKEMSSTKNEEKELKNKCKSRKNARGHDKYKESAKMQDNVQTTDISQKNAEGDNPQPVSSYCCTTLGISDALKISDSELSIDNPFHSEYEVFQANSNKRTGVHRSHNNERSKTRKNILSYSMNDVCSTKDYPDVKSLQTERTKGKTDIVRCKMVGTDLNKHCHGYQALPKDLRKSKESPVGCSFSDAYFKNDLCSEIRQKDRAMYRKDRLSRSMDDIKVKIKSTDTSRLMTQGILIPCVNELCQRKHAPTSSGIPQKKRTKKRTEKMTYNDDDLHRGSDAFDEFSERNKQEEDDVDIIPDGEHWPHSGNTKRKNWVLERIRNMPLTFVSCIRKTVND